MRVLSLILIAMTLLVSGFGLYRAWFPVSRAIPTAGSSAATEDYKRQLETKAMKHEASELTSGLTTESRRTEP